MEVHRPSDSRSAHGHRQIWYPSTLRLLRSSKVPRHHTHLHGPQLVALRRSAQSTIITVVRDYRSCDRRTTSRRSDHSRQTKPLEPWRRVHLATLSAIGAPHASAVGATL